MLYIDIDIHHGDGVQEAFYKSNRVLTVSFHKYAQGFFPGTGGIEEVGNQLGKYFSLNIPLADGIDNESYVSLFKAVMEPTIHTFRPSVVVLQCGADSLGCDRLGAFNLSIAAHGECVRFIKSFNLPLLVLGGGGYTMKNVARCWTYETAVLLDKHQDLSPLLPATAYDDFFAPDHKLHPPISGRVLNANTREQLEKALSAVLERLRFLHGAPSVAMQEIPPDLSNWLAKEEDERTAQEREEACSHDTGDQAKATTLLEPEMPLSATRRTTSSRRVSGNRPARAREQSGTGNKSAARKRRPTASISGPMAPAADAPADGGDAPGQPAESIDQSMAIG